MEERPGEIGGTVSADTDNDDVGETGILGAELQLFTDPNGDGDASDGTFVVSTTTESDGSYSFENLAPGDYVVVETQPAGFNTVSDGDSTVPGDDASNISLFDNAIPVSIAGGETDDGNDFLEEAPGSLSGQVLADTDNDDGGDTPLQDVVLTLKDENGNDIDSDPNTAGVQSTTAKTDSEGNYSFAGLPPGNYQVVETDSAGFQSVSDVDGANNNTVGDETPIAVAAGQNTAGNDFVDEQLGSLSGRVLADNNNDGAGEDALAGVVLTLKDETGADIDSDPNTAGVQPTTTLSDSTGNYSFGGLPPGNYQVVETDTAGFQSVSDVDGANNNTIGDETPLVVMAGQNTPGNDFVDEQLGSLSGQVLADIDSDGDGDDALANVILTLKDESGADIDSDPNTAGVQPTTTTTNSEGNYSFAGLPPGNYQVVETDTAGFQSVSDVDGANNNTVGDETPIVVAAGQNAPGNDFVDEELGSLSGQVLEDTDNNNVGDAALANVVLTLKDENGNDIDSDPIQTGVQPTTTSTDSEGNYSFAGLPPGNYQVVEQDRSGFISVSDVDGANNNVVGDETPIAVTPGADSAGNDFVDERSGDLRGRVLADIDNDDVGDEPLVDVVLTLKDENGDDIDSDPSTPGVQPTTATTDSNGFYLFSNLPPGDYQIVEQDLAGYDSVGDSDGANNNIVGDETPVTVVGGFIRGGNDFVDEQFGSLSGQVLEDTDNNDEGDAPLENIVLTLKDENGDDIDSDPNTAGIQPTTTSTDSAGNYSFAGLPPGNYQVVEEDLAQFVSVSDVDGANNNVVGDETPIAVTAGADTSGNDFVDERSGDLRGRVLADIDNDDVGDEPLADVVLTLKDENGDDIDSDPSTPGVQPTTATTDSNGFYLFSNLPPGDYQIVEQDLAGYDSVSDSDGANNNIVGDETPVTVVGGFISSGNDFVDEQFASVSGFVLQDTTGDGNGNGGVETVELTLFTDPNGDGDPSDGVAVDTASTGPDGSYLFANVSPGDYVVVETQPVDLLTVRDFDGSSPEDDAANANSTDNAIPVSVNAGESDTENNFIEAEPSSISGRVLEDIDNDNAGDVGIEGVILTLVSDTGEPIDADGDASNGVQPVTATTNSNGEYVFEGVLFGDYGVLETQPSGFETISDGDETVPGDDAPNSDPSDNFIPVSLTPGESDTGNNFVEFALKPSTYEEFQTEFADVLGAQNAPGDNPDGDIYNNALEYALCLHPGSGLESHGGFCLTKAPDGTVTAEFMRARGGLSDVTYTLEGADTLGTPTAWTAITSVSETVNTTDSDVPRDAEKVLFNNLEAASEFSDGTTSGVVRLGVEIDGVTYYTKSFGWQCHGYNDYECATFSTPFSEKPVYSGTFGDGALTLATDGDGNVTFDVSDAASSDLTSVVGSNGEYYLQITSGDLEGQRFDILNGGVGELTLVNDSDIFEETVATLNTMNGLPADALLQGQTFEVIRFQTVDDLFDPMTNFAGEEDSDPNDFTRLLFYNSRSSTPGFEILGLVGTNTANSKWVLTNDLVTQTDQGGMRLDPCGGNWVHPKSSGDPANPSSTPIEVQSFGMIADHDQACAFNEGFNLTGAVYPFDQTPAGANGRDLTVAPAGFEGGIDPDQATELLFWQGDTVVDDPSVLSYEERYANYMLLDGGGMQNWIDINDVALQNLDSVLLLESHRAVFLKLLPGDEKAAHIYPLPPF